MNQQINLYQSMFRKQKVVLPASAIAVVLGVVLVAFAVLGVAKQSQFNTQSKQLAQLEKSKTSMQTQVDELKTKLPSLEKDPALPLQIAALEGERDLKRQAIAMLGDKKLGNTEGFSGLLEGLARRRVSSVWLEHISFASGGNDLSLVGSARSPELVPRLLGVLRDEAAFVGLSFDFLKMQRDAKEQDLVHFYFGTTPRKSEQLASGGLEGAAMADAGGGALIDAVQQYWQQRVSGVPSAPSEGAQ